MYYALPCRYSILFWTRHIDVKLFFLVLSAPFQVLLSCVLLIEKTFFRTSISWISDLHPFRVVIKCFTTKIRRFDPNYIFNHLKVNLSIIYKMDTNNDINLKLTSSKSILCIYRHCPRWSLMFPMTIKFESYYSHWPLSTCGEFWSSKFQILASVSALVLLLSLLLQWWASD